LQRVWEDNILVFDSSDETKFLRHVIINGFHVKNHAEAKAFAEEVAKFVNPIYRLALDLGVYKVLQNFCIMLNCKVGSTRVKRLRFGNLEKTSDSLIAYISDDSVLLPPVNGKVALPPCINNEIDVVDENRERERPERETRERDQRERETRERQERETRERERPERERPERERPESETRE